MTRADLRLQRAKEGVAEFTVPLSWKAWQAALSALNVVVTVAQQNSGLPRWSAEMRLPTGVIVSENGVYMSSIHLLAAKPSG